MNWLLQFDKDDRESLLKLLSQVIYVTEAEFEKALVRLNAELVHHLAAAGIPAKNIIYAQVDQAGSSSGAVLNRLRDLSGLELRGCKFVDSRDVREIHKSTSNLGEGAIIVVDDFAGTGKQMRTNWLAMSEYVVGSFPVFFLIPCACEEALSVLQQLGAVYYEYLHLKSERPLHLHCGSLRECTKDRLVKLSFDIHSRIGLGFQDAATMLVLARNAPNTVPHLLRGSPTQVPIKGVFPRYKDLPLDE